MFIPLTPDKYAAALKALAAAVGGGDVISFETSGPDGILKTKDVDLGIAYDGTNLAVSILSRHTFKAKLASDDQIKSRLVELLNKVTA